MLLQRCNNTASFAEHLKFFKKYDFAEVFLVKRGKTKYKMYNKDTIHFENLIYRMLHKRSKITTPFSEHLKFQEKITFTHSLWVKRGKTK